MRPHDNAWLFSARDSRGIVHAQGIWSDHVQYVTIDGRRLMARVQGMTYVTGRSSLSINVFDPTTMLPVSSVQHLTDGSAISQKFDGAHVETTRTASAGAASVVNNTDLTTQPFDYYGGMWGLLLATMPLSTGEVGEFPSIDEYEDQPANAVYHVVGREWVAAGAR